MTTTLIAQPQRPTRTILSAYDVVIDGEDAGEVWQLPGRSFSGAWCASAGIHSARRKPTRKAAVAWVEAQHERNKAAS